MPNLSQLISPTPSSSTPSSPPPPPPPSPPAIGASPLSVSFNATQGGVNPATQSIAITNIGGGTLSWSASDTAPWLTVAPGSGTGNGAVMLTASTSGLNAGLHSAILTVTAPGASSLAVPVSFNVTAAPTQPTISMSPTNLAFTGTVGGSSRALTRESSL